MTSLIAVYSSSSSSHSNLAKITFSMLDLKNHGAKQSIYSELELLNGVEENNLNVDAGILEIIVDYNLFSLEDFKTSLDKWGYAFEDFKVEDVYH